MIIDFSLFTDNKTVFTDLTFWILLFRVIFEVNIKTYHNDVKS